jgi:DNA repair photolyase
MLITPFDPWNSELCTCPEKLTFNPYTGCDHLCLYCYASSYIPRFRDCRPKKDLISKLKKEARRLKGELVSISNSSDPYPRLEQRLGLTRKCLKTLAESSCRLQIITKSDLVVRDIDILRRVPSVVSVTILTEDDVLSSKLEPGAPVSSKRLEAVETLVKAGIPVTVRIDPLIPYLNDDLVKLVEAVANLGVHHITSSTYKIKPDNWKRFSRVFPGVAEKLQQLYFKKGERVGRSIYLPIELRFNLMKRVNELVEKNNLKFGCCREGFRFNSVVCDGSWAIQMHE